MPANTKKRFIAGAICPACKSMDTIQMYREDSVDFRECVSCGFHDQLRFKPQVKELDTRVNISEEQVQRETSVIKIMDPGKTRD